jgi:hypothetical protein
MYPLSKLETFPTLTSVMSEDLALQQGASRLQITSADLWKLAINITSPLRIHFPLLSSIELCHYHVTSIILLPRIKFLYSSGLSLAFVIYTFNALLL